MVYVCAKLQKFSALRGRDPRGGGGGGPTPPPGCEMGSKDPAFLGLMNTTNFKQDASPCMAIWELGAFIGSMESCLVYD